MKRNLTNKNFMSSTSLKAKKIVLSFAIFLTTCTFVNAQGACTGFGSVLLDLWEGLYEVAHPIGQQALILIPVVGQIDEATQAISDASVAFHNEVFNENSQSWATIGARGLPVVKTQTRQFGTLTKVGVGGVRTFTTTGQLWDKVEIVIEKTGGRAKTDIIICTWDLVSGAKNNYVEYTFENGKYNRSRTFLIKNVHGKSISIKLKNKSATNTFKYIIKSKGFLNIAKQRKRALGNINHINAKKKSATRN